MLYACDRHWWEYHLDAVRSAFSGELWTQAEAKREALSEEGEWWSAVGIRCQRGAHAPGLGRSVIHYGNNSGYQAINLAWLLYRPARILLLGYDMHADGPRHFFGDHPPPMNAPSPYHEWVPGFDALARDLASEGVQAINCTRKTALRCFVQSTIRDVLC